MMAHECDCRAYVYQPGRRTCLKCNGTPITREIQPVLMDADITLENHGSIVLVRPLTPDGNRWLTDNVTSDALWFAGAVVVEPRYLEPLIDGMIGDGLIVRGE